MQKEAIRIFGIILDDMDSLYTDIQRQFYKLLDLDDKKLSIYPNEDIKTKETIKYAIQTFDFNRYELNFLVQVRNIIEEEMKKFEFSDNYDLIQKSLIERLKGLKNIEFSLEYDFKELSRKIENSFVSQETFNNYFMAKREVIENMIKSYNQNVIDVLIYWTPRLVEEMKRGNQKKEVLQEPSIPSLGSANSIIDRKQLIETCKDKYNEFQRRLLYLMEGNYGTGTKIFIVCGKLRNVISMLDKFINKMSLEENFQDLINKYSDVKDSNKMIELIISDVVNLESLIIEIDRIYGKRAKMSYEQYDLPLVDFDALHERIINSNSVKDLLVGKKTIEKGLGNYDYDTNQKLKEEYYILLDRIIFLSVKNTKKNNSMLNSVSGNDSANKKSKFDIKYLIDSNNFYGILRSIDSSDIEKYKEFIMLGLDIAMEEWLHQNELCNTFVEKERSFYNFSQLYENFKIYLPIDIENMLRQYLEILKENMEKSSDYEIELDDVRGSGRK